MKKTGKYLLYMILTLLIALVGFIKFHPTFGAGDQNINREVVQKSVNFTQQKFQNLIPTPMMTGTENDETMWEGLRSMLFPPEGKHPAAPLPSIVFDKANFKNGDFVWLGHSTVLFKVNNRVILTDPVFHRASPVPVIGKEFQLQNKTKIKDLPEIDTVVISHDHYDHLDYRAILQLAEKSQNFVVPLGNKSHLAHWGIDESKIIEKDWYESTLLDGVEFILTPSRHFSGRSLTDGNQTLWGAWIIKSKDTNIYFSGDTGYFDEFKKVGQKYGPFDIAFIDSGAYNAAWAHVHMQPEESVQTAIDLQAASYLPIGWGKFDLAYHPWDEPIIRAWNIAQKKDIKIATPLVGEVFDLKNIPQTKWWEDLR